MTSIQRVRMTRQDYTRLHQELASLRSRRGIEVPDDFMDFDANAHRARHERDKPHP